MQKSKVYVFIFDGYSDWEPPYAMAEISKSNRYQLLTVAMNNKPIRSVGGLTIIPDLQWNELEWSDAVMIIVPGGNAWEEKKHREMIPMLKDYIQQNGKVAAICSATTLLGDMGVLDTVKHTSNAKFYLQHYVTDYQGGDNYIEEPAVSDKNIITATGTAPVEFAREIFKALSLMNESKIEEWFQLFKNGIWEKSDA
ncbi:type 1 glutamine amidotransferase family protein [Chryseolinea sp. H1M3-3]|uniref:type 1 glutamine amidotransferase family protein n=1 Tax=Chryseolinea sp. H1M3-3 TaxID=3034144 RepID=UPI0023EB1D7D|nr:type 1 glutamine amidotransferase family protein [Chryseolinea sp. H1M3-3]